MRIRHTIEYHFIMVSLCIIKFTTSAELNPDAASRQKFLDKYTIPEKTPGPIDIKSQETFKVPLVPILFIGVIGEPVKLVNNGKSVEAIIDENQNKYFTQVTGGPLFYAIYKIHKIRYYWTDDTSKPALTTVDGKNGAPLEVAVIFYNLQHGSFKNATNFRNGLAIFTFRVGIGGLPNLRFIPFEPRLKSVQQAGSKIESNLGQSFAWFDNYLPSTQYFAYPGSYVDEETGNEYYCTTTIIFPQVSHLSEEQFNSTFGSLKNKDGEPLTNSGKQKPNNMPVIQSEGVLQLLVPAGDDILDLPL